jgi:hypothetical protein
MEGSCSTGQSPQWAVVQVEEEEEEEYQSRNIGQVAGSFECGNEPSGSIKCAKFLG